MGILDLIQKYLDEQGYPSNRRFYWGYNGFCVKWIDDNGAYCEMDAWRLLNKMIRYELQKEGG